VEFALVVPILLLMVFGIVDYGLWFEDSIALRQGVREGARQGIVENFGATPCTGVVASANIQRLICTVKSDAGTATGTTYVKVEVLDENGANPGTAWKQGGTLRVCAMTADTSVTGFIPLPADGLIKSRVDMRIEQDDAGAATGPGGGADAPPPGADWTWCGA
jgi:Flp pilus assembly protein TadG